MASKRSRTACLCRHMSSLGLLVHLVQVGFRQLQLPLCCSAGTKQHWGSWMSMDLARRAWLEIALCNHDPSRFLLSSLKAMRTSCCCQPS
jgi:hypothetical protein